MGGGLGFGEILVVLDGRWSWCHQRIDWSRPGSNFDRPLVAFKMEMGAVAEVQSCNSKNHHSRGDMLPGLQTSAVGVSGVLRVDLSTGFIIYFLVFLLWDACQLSHLFHPKSVRNVPHN